LISPSIIALIDRSRKNKFVGTEFLLDKKPPVEINHRWFISIAGKITGSENSNQGK
jgi:hypothetical protein